MKKDLIIKIILWIIVIAVAVFIFCFSAQDATESNETSGGFLRMVFGIFPGFHGLSEAAQAKMIEDFMTVARKCAHFCIYAMLGFWLQFLARQYTAKFVVLISTAAAFIYAITDELHQYFVPGRSCQLKDVCIDTAGALFGALISLLLVVIWQFLRKTLAKKK